MLNDSNSTRDSVQNIMLFFVDVMGVLSILCFWYNMADGIQTYEC